jgi:hypothetical protein
MQSIREKKYPKNPFNCVSRLSYCVNKNHLPMSNNHVFCCNLCISVNHITVDTISGINVLVLSTMHPMTYLCILAAINIV